jgi:hypothetical protein
MKYFNVLFIVIVLSLCVLPQQVEAGSPLDGLVPFLKPPAPDYVINGDTVYVDNDNVRIEATPHTLTSSGWVTVKFWVKKYDGPLDICYGFDGIDKVEALKTEVYEEVDKGNGKKEQDWNKNDKEFAKSSIAYKGSSKWQAQNLRTVAKNTVYTTRVWIEIPFNGLDKSIGKYTIGIKPSGESIDKAWVLDPWYNATWLYRKQLTVYGSSAAVQTNYQKLIRVYKADVGADVAENIAQYTSTSNTVTNIYGVNWEAMTFTAETTGTAKKIWLKLNKNGVPTTSYACAIRATAAGAPTGANLCSGNITSTQISATADWYEFDMGAGTAITSGTVYAVILYNTGAAAGNDLQWRIHTASLYTGGQRYYSSNSGTTWATFGAAQGYLFQVLTSTSGTTPLRIDTEAHCQADFDDLRFTADDSTTLLDYWIENSGTCVADGYADCWVEIPSIVQMTSLIEHTHLYLYYGNSAATTYYNGTNTFIKFENFEWGANGDSISASGGSVSWSVSSGTAAISTDHAYGGTRSMKLAGNGALSLALMTLGFTASSSTVIETRVYKETAANDSRFINTGMSNTQIFIIKGDAAEDMYYFNAASAWVDTTVNMNADSWDLFGLQHFNGTDSTVDLARNRVTARVAVGAYGGPDSNYVGRLIFLSTDAATQDVYFDNVLVYKFAVSQPLWGTPSAEDPIPWYAITLSSSGWSTNWAIVNGNFSPAVATDVVTQRGFDYGLTTSYGSSWTETGSWTQAVFSTTLTGLSPATVYHYRAKVYFNSTWYYGADMVFSTKGSPTTYEYWNTGGDGDSFKVNSANWTYQTFTTNTTAISHSVTSIKLKLKRVGSPGTITASIKNTANSTTGQTCWSYPTGSDIISATYDGDTIDLAYTWYEFVPSVETCLSANTTYAIVVRALSGDSSNYVLWQTDFGGGYTGGNAGYSIDSGVAFVTNCPTDQLFEIWGNPSLEVLDAKVFSTYAASGDWLITVLYKNFFQPYYEQAADVQSLFYLQLVHGTTVVASSVVPEWGYRPACIYLDATEVAALEWGHAYTVRIYGNFGAYPYMEYALQSVDWLGSDLTRLDSWVRSTATLMASYYSTDYTEYVAGKGQVLNEAGGVIFANNIPELDTIRPDIFRITTDTIGFVPDDYDQELQDELVWQTMLGPQLTRAFALTGNAFGVEAPTVGALIGFLIYALVALLCFRPGHALAAMVIPVPIIIIIWGTGLLELAMMGITLAVATVLLAWQLWFKSR